LDPIGRMADFLQNGIEPYLGFQDSLLNRVDRIIELDGLDNARISLK
jgi:hypothetical protein